MERPKKIVLIACASSKLDTKCEAQFLYDSALFDKSLNYSKLIKADKTFILSALHCLLPLNKEIEPYNKTLNKMSDVEVREWSNKVIEQLREEADLENDTFIFLAGNNYRKYLVPHLQKVEIPMEGLKIGKQLQWLSNQLKQEPKDLEK